MSSRVAEQFGRSAAAYVQSPVHASGPDLTAISELASKRHFTNALDLGCGGGHVSFALAPHVARVTAYDLSPEMLQAMSAEAATRGHTNIVATLGVAERLPFDSASFDLVVSRFSAHHWQNVPVGLAEARRVLRADGLAIFIDVYAPEDPLLDTFLQTVEMLRDPSHVRDYSVSQWQQMLKAAGFRPEQPRVRKLATEFTSWIARMSTPDVLAQAILKLQGEVPDEVRKHFGIMPNGDFELDAMFLEAVPH